MGKRMSIDFYAGTPTYHALPEPQVAVDDVVFDRSGLAWIKADKGWVPAGDTRPQDWHTEVSKWF